MSIRGWDDLNRFVCAPEHLAEYELQVCRMCSQFVQVFARGGLEFGLHQLMYFRHLLELHTNNQSTTNSVEDQVSYSEMNLANWLQIVCPLTSQIDITEFVNRFIIKTDFSRELLFLTTNLLHTLLAAGCAPVERGIQVLLLELELRGLGIECSTLTAMQESVDGRKPLRQLLMIALATSTWPQWMRPIAVEAFCPFSMRIPQDDPQTVRIGLSWAQFPLIMETKNLICEQLLEKYHTSSQLLDAHSNDIHTNSQDYELKLPAGMTVDAGYACLLLFAGLIATVQQSKDMLSFANRTMDVLCRLQCAPLDIHRIWTQVIGSTSTAWNAEGFKWLHALLADAVYATICETSSPFSANLSLLLSTHRLESTTDGALFGLSTVVSSLPISTPAEHALVFPYASPELYQYWTRILVRAIVIKWKSELTISQQKLDFVLKINEFMLSIASTVTNDDHKKLAWRLLLSLLHKLFVKGFSLQKWKDLVLEMPSAPHSPDFDPLATGLTARLPENLRNTMGLLIEEWSLWLTVTEQQMVLAELNPMRLSSFKISPSKLITIFESMSRKIPFIPFIAYRWKAQLMCLVPQQINVATGLIDLPSHPLLNRDRVVVMFNKLCPLLSERGLVLFKKRFRLVSVNMRGKLPMPAVIRLLPPTLAVVLYEFSDLFYDRPYDWFAVENADQPRNLGDEMMATSQCCPLPPVMDKNQIIVSFVVQGDSTTVQCPIGPSDSLKKLFGKFNSLKALTAKRVVYKFCGEILDDSKSVSSAGINHGSMLNCILI